MQRFAFAGFTLDLAAGRLLLGTKDVKIRPKSFALLAFMLRNAGRIISKDELLSALWPDVTVTEDSLTQCIHDIRRALGREGPGLVQTIPRRGYLFSLPDDHQEQPAVLTMSAAQVSDLMREAAPAEAHRLRRDGIAVLPFTLVGPPNASNQGLLDGLGHDIIGRLARLRCFHVIARGSTFSLGHLSLDPQAAGQALGVAYVVVGRARFDGSRVTLRIELVDCSIGTVIWMDDFSDNCVNYGTLLYDMTDRVILSLHREITTAERNRSLSLPVPSLDAWQAYHRGLFHMLQFTSTELQQAEGFFSLSVDRDPSFSRSHAALSYCHFLEAFLRPPDQRGDRADLALKSASRAMQLDDQSPASRWAYGRALWLNGDKLGGIREMRTSVEISPSFAMGYQSLSFFLCQSGAPADAVECATIAEGLSPFDPFLCAIYGSKAMALLRLGNVDHAVDFAFKAAQQHNVHKHILAISVLVLAVAGRMDEANLYLDRVRKFDPGYSLGKFKGAFSGLSDDALAIVHGIAPRIGLS